MARENLITHHTNLAGGRSIQSYVTMSDSYVALDFNGMEVQDYQEWTIEDARAIARLLMLAVADAEAEA